VYTPSSCRYTALQAGSSILQRQSCPRAGAHAIDNIAHIPSCQPPVQCRLILTIQPAMWPHLLCSARRWPARWLAQNPCWCASWTRSRGLCSTSTR
jgi:hypothetical protein